MGRSAKERGCREEDGKKEREREREREREKVRAEARGVTEL